jgi:hypothetical protein
LRNKKRKDRGERGDRSSDFSKIMEKIRKYVDANPLFLTYSKCLKTGRKLSDFISTYITED